MGNPDIGWLAPGIFALIPAAGVICLLIRAVRRFRAGDKAEAVFSFIAVFVLLCLAGLAIAVIFHSN